MTPKGLIPLLGAALVALAETSWGQKSPDWPVNWRVFRMADGLPESACASVALAPQGKVLVRHPQAGSVSELDGYTVSVIPAPGPGRWQRTSDSSARITRAGCDLRQPSRLPGARWCPHPPTHGLDKHRLSPGPSPGSGVSGHGTECGLLAKNASQFQQASLRRGDHRMDWLYF